MAPAIWSQDSFSGAHRSHWYASVGAGSPVACVEAVSVSPTNGEPLIVGVVSVGGVSPAAGCAVAIMAIPMIDAAPSRVIVLVLSMAALPLGSSSLCAT